MRVTGSRVQPGDRFTTLVERGILSAAELEVATNLARDHGHEVATILLDQYQVPKDELVRSLGEFYKAEIFEFDGEQVIAQRFRTLVSAEFWRQNCCAPISSKEGQVEIAIARPLDDKLLEKLEHLQLAPKLELTVGLERDIFAYIDHSYPRYGGTTQKQAEAAYPVANSTPDSDILRPDAHSTSAVLLVKEIVKDACRLGVSDIHIEPNGLHQPCFVRFRRDGECFTYMEVPPSLHSSLISRIKVLAELDIAEKRKPQDGKIRFRLDENSDAVVELRVATLPTAGQPTEDIVLRILSTSRLLRLHEIGLTELNFERLRDVARKPYGLFLCVGPTGSGKTTTLHSILSYVNRDTVKIWTAEDPVEITQPGLRQVQVRPKIGLDFGTALRSFLRADPDIIMVGEMRDEETARVGVEASLTGHLVLSTLHTNSASETISRLLDLGVDRFNFADSLLGILAQRLTRTLCESCRESYRPSQREIAELNEAYGIDADGPLELPENLVLYRPRGCKECGNRGFLGRTALHELLIVDEDIRGLIVRGAPVAEVKRLAIDRGMRTLMQDGVKRVLAGHTDLRQVRAVCLR